jgi:predicted ThiF/HesA family dinucleotide-utilizing enzyme
MDERRRRAMFANIKGRKVPFGTKLTINTGRKDRRVTLMEKHRGDDPKKICVIRNGKMMQVSKSSVIKIG